MRQEVGRPRRVFFGRLRALPLLGDAAGLLDQRFLDRRDRLLLLFLFPMASSAASWARRNLFSNRSKTSARIGNLIAESFAQ